MERRPTAEALDLNQHRQLLWRLCYRMTGSAADADDLVQETFRRALEAPPPDLTRELRPWLVRVAVNLSRDALRARKRRGYDGTWLPSPIETQAWADVRASGEGRYSELESVTFAFLLALEALRPTQRAVLLLRDVLDYSVAETARVLELSEANVKTSLHRARSAMQGYEGSRLPLTPERIHATGKALRALCMHLFAHNVPALEALLARDVRALHDGGGEFFAARRPVFGLARVIKLHLKTLRRVRGHAAIRSVNGLPALVVELPSANARIAQRAVLTIDLDAEGKIRSVDTVVATSKLTAVRFETLAAPNLAFMAELVRAGLCVPPLGAWLPRVARSTLRRLSPKGLVSERFGPRLQGRLGDADEAEV